MIRPPSITSIWICSEAARLNPAFIGAVKALEMHTTTVMKNNSMLPRSPGNGPVSRPFRPDPPPQEKEKMLSVISTPAEHGEHEPDPRGVRCPVESGLLACLRQDHEGQADQAEDHQQDHRRGDLSVPAGPRPLLAEDPAEKEHEYDRPASPQDRGHGGVDEPGAPGEEGELERADQDEEDRPTRQILLDESQHVPVSQLCAVPAQQERQRACGCSCRQEGAEQQRTLRRSPPSP